MGCLSYTTQSMCPDQELNLWPIALWDDAQATEPHQSGLLLWLLNKCISLHFFSASLTFTVTYKWFSRPCFSLTTASSLLKLLLSSMCWYLDNFPTSRGSIDSEVIQGWLLGIVVMFFLMNPALPGWVHCVRISCAVYSFVRGSVVGLWSSSRGGAGQAWSGGFVSSRGWNSFCGWFQRFNK